MKAIAVQNEQNDVIKVFPDAVEYYESIGWKVVADKPVVEPEEEVESE
jgi:hypothetical protein